MKILANENFPGEAVEALRQQGHDILWIRSESPGISDLEVLRHAQLEERTLITFDKDFGELAFRLGLTVQSGIVLFRIPTLSPAYVASVAFIAFGTPRDWAGYFSVVEEDRIRMTPFPSENGQESR